MNRRSMLRRGTVAAGLLSALALAGCSASGKHGDAAKKIEPADVPQPVMDSINSRFPGAQITSVEREKERGTIVYDFELRQNGRKYESDVKQDGTIMEIEKQVAAQDVPEAVTRAARQSAPGAKVKEVMEVNKVSGKQETPDHYEVVMTTAEGKEKEIVVSLEGKVMKDEAAEEKK